MSTDIKVSMTSPQMGRFIFPTPIQQMGRFNGNHASFLRITVSEEIPSHYKGEKVVAFLENAGENKIYTPKKELTVDVYSDADDQEEDIIVSSVGTETINLVTNSIW